MKTRILTAVVAILIFLPFLIFSASPNPLLPIGIGVMSVIAVFEMAGCVGLSGAWILTVPVALLAAGAPFAVRYIGSAETVAKFAFAGFALISLYFMAVLTFSKGKYPLGDAAVFFFAGLYILIGFNAILVIRDYEPMGQFSYLIVFLAAWMTDIFAYFCGMLFGRGGKHKLIPEISPKKTVEGAVGGVVFCVLFMVLYAFLLNRFADLNANYWVFVLGGFLASVVAQIGDLCMSMIKRHYRIKDYGKIFPGHGGMLDRFDSVIAVSCALLIVTTFFDFFEVL